jgi:hypothetical protein
MAKTVFLSEKNDLHVNLAFDVMATSLTLDVAVERLKNEHGITTTAARLEGTRRYFPERFEKVYRETAPIREAVLVDGMVENAQLATQAEARAARRTIEMLDAGAVKEPWRVFRDVADAKAKNIDKSRLMQEKPTHITQTISDTQFYAIEAELERLIAGENVADAEVVEKGELPPAP